MSATTIHLDPCLPGNTPLAAAPARYIVGPRATYAHMARSLSVGKYGPFARGWCGQGFRMDGQHRWTNDLDGRELCGTCYGREAGYDSDLPGIKFSPTLTLSNISRYRWCPGSTLELVVEHGHRDATCLLCGHHGRMRAGGSAHSGTWRIERHAPEVETALIFCPSCGYKRLFVRDGAVRCSSFRCDFHRPALVA